MKEHVERGITSWIAFFSWARLLIIRLFIIYAFSSLVNAHAIQSRLVEFIVAQHNSDESTSQAARRSEYRMSSAEQGWVWRAWNWNKELQTKRKEVLSFISRRHLWDFNRDSEIWNIHDELAFTFCLCADFQTSFDSEQHFPFLSKRIRWLK